MKVEVGVLYSQASRNMNRFWKKKQGNKLFSKDSRKLADTF